MDAVHYSYWGQTKSQMLLFQQHFNGGDNGTFSAFVLTSIANL